MIHTKSSRIEIRTNEETKRLIETAANITGKTLSAYIISNSISSAQKDIELMESITLRNRDRDLFFSLISDPPAPNQALKALLNSDWDR